MKKRNITFLLCVFSSIFILVFDFFKFDLIIKASYSFGALIVVGFLVYIPYVLFGILAIWSVIHAIKRMQLKRWRALIPASIMAITILILSFFPYSKTYLNIFYLLNKDEFQKTIQLMNSGEMQNYAIDENEYIAPYRLTSYSGKVYADDSSKIMFFAYYGFGKAVAIVYSSDDSGIGQYDFSDKYASVAYWNFCNIDKIDTNWYSATVF